ncbi:MAG: class I SAM-dependent methyltransferase [Ruegeria sp.]|nr:class I SAM-dependent methyltransferase [Ruegeria sp.]
MITVEQMAEATALPEIQSLSFKAFSREDVVNLIMQRSEIIHDQPRSAKIIRSWIAGDFGPAASLVDQNREELVRRAAAIIYLEYQQLRGTIADCAPKAIADIGCGYAIFDLFLWRDTACKLVLIDLEKTDERHFGFNETGAAYSNLATAKAFLIENGVEPEQVHCRNPAVDNLNSDAPVDIAFSFISCGFHYPVETYLGYFKDVVAENGSIILDLRAKKARQGKRLLHSVGEVSDLVDAARGSANRVLVKKAQG